MEDEPTKLEFKEQLLVRNTSNEAIIEENEITTNSPTQEKKNSKINNSGETEGKNENPRHSHYEDIVHPNMEQEMHSEFKS